MVKYHYEFKSCRNNVIVGKFNTLTDLLLLRNDYVTINNHKYWIVDRHLSADLYEEEQIMNYYYRVMRVQYNGYYHGLPNR